VGGLGVEGSERWDSLEGRRLKLLFLFFLLSVLVWGTSTPETCAQPTVEGDGSLCRTEGRQP